MAKRETESAAECVTRPAAWRGYRRSAAELEHVIRSAGIALLVAGDALPDECFGDPAVQLALKDAVAQGVAVRVLVGRTGRANALRLLGHIAGAVRVAEKPIGLLYVVSDHNNVWIGPAPRREKRLDEGMYRDSLRSAQRLLEHFEKSFRASTPQE